jgi:hypothetical protein
VGKKARREVWEAMQGKRQAQQPQQEQIDVVPMEPSKFPSASMQEQGWIKLKKPGQFGWFRKTGDGRDLILYQTFNGEENTLAYAWGCDLARKNVPRSFVEQVAGDYSGSLFAQVLLKGFDDFHRPAKIERIRLDYEREAQ